MKKNNQVVIEGIESEFVGHGLVFGKFMPPTNGHLYLINFARRSCCRLTIIVCSLPTEPIAGEQRYAWMKELFSDCNVIHHYIEIAQEPKGPDDANFFNIWRDSIRRHCPGEKFDALFASEPYGYRMADVLGTKFIPVDVRRNLVRISGTELRKNPLRHWEHLHPVVRPYFLKRVAIVGAEASGKSALAEDLAGYFGTVSVGEYASAMRHDFRENISCYDPAQPVPGDVSTIARGQMASEDSLARLANRIMFCDTELLTVVRRALSNFKECPAWIAKEAERRKYDLYLLLNPRGGGDWWQAELMRRGQPFIVLDEDDRAALLKKAVAAVCEKLPLG